MVVKPIIQRRFVAQLLSPRKKLIFNKPKDSDASVQPARTRFAPSPTGFLHMGSLRTALYNYLYAKHTGGQFLLRLEDTDRTRLVEGAEQNLYDCLKWLGLKYDEGPDVGGPHAPYRQSDRREIYKKYADELVSKGLAYYCFCDKDRLNDLRESAMKLKPPTNVTYDRYCVHKNQEETDSLKRTLSHYTIRFKSPAKYSSFTDLLHGELNLQPQVNENDIRYDDFIIMKSDGLPTYHFANVVDDHLMKITHVIRGEEWLPSTPKHISLYDAFGWKAPHFIHIPLLTSTENKKLSKRAKDNNVWSLKNDGILPEALINFAVLFGWSLGKSAKGVSENEMFSLSELESKFDISGLTKGNAKVDSKKLMHFNKLYLSNKLKDVATFNNLVDEHYPKMISNNSLSKKQFSEILKIISGNLTTMNELKDFKYLFEKPDFDTLEVENYLKTMDKNKTISILKLASKMDLKGVSDFTEIVKSLATNTNSKNSDVYHAFRFALSGCGSGIKLPVLVSIIGIEETKIRLEESISILNRTQ